MGAATLACALVLVRPAVAAEEDEANRQPHVCVAQWAHPTRTCAWSEPLVVKASGKTEETARKNAVARLRISLTALTRAALLDAQGTLAELHVTDLVACARVPEDEIMVACMASPNLARDGICYADLPPDPCWTVSPTAWEGLGWQVAEEARHQVCEDVSAQADTRAGGEAERLRCRARCLSKVTVRCIGP